MATEPMNHPEQPARPQQTPDQPDTPRPAALCRAQYPTPRGVAPGARIVRCGLPAGHPGEHEEAETEVTWAAEPIVAPAAVDPVPETVPEQVLSEAIEAYEFASYDAPTRRGLLAALASVRRPLLEHIAELEVALDEAQDEIGRLRADLDFQTAAAFDNQAAVNRMRTRYFADNAAVERDWLLAEAPADLCVRFFAVRRQAEGEAVGRG
jgi:hypothetical protein